MTKSGSTIPTPGAERRPEAVASLRFAEARSLKRELLEELRRGAGAGLPVRPEDLLPRWPADPKNDPDVASLLFADYLARRGQGEPASASDYEQRFPEHRDSLANLLRQHGVLRSLGQASGGGVTLRLPDVGEELFGFRLRQELGRGAFARVFLAEQVGLADRPVVLKISGIEGGEPQTLAQLQHTHIVPIHSVHEDAPAGLRAVCMPYFGGASLSRVLEALWQKTSRPTEGRQLVEALESVLSTKDEGRSTQNTRPLDALGKTTYIRAVAEIIARLADALQHAHQRGIQHRDIKPSNILLSADGQPMLLDFNLAQDARQQPAHAALGGTVAYMAPEHLRALAARDPALSRLVDHRSDVYALGMVLYELLTGVSPFDQSASYTPLPMLIEAMALERGHTVPSLRQKRPDVPWGLESIARKCLEPDQNRRYQNAAELAEDLRRFLDDRPLKHAPELSAAERLRKWARRHPRLTSSASVAAVAAVLLTVTAGGAAAVVTTVRQHQVATQEALNASRAEQRRREYEEGTREALCLVNATPALSDHTPATLEHTRRGQAVCEQTLGLYQVLERPDWEQHPDWQRLAPEDRRRLAEDTRELLLLLAFAREELAPGSPDGAREALALLDRAEAVAGLEPSPALAEARAACLARLGDAAGADRAREEARRRQPTSARDHYLLAISYVRNAPGDPAACTRAVAELEEAVRLSPRHYWSWLQKGLCRQELCDHAAAAADFGVCIGLWPEFAWGYFNRGYSLAQGGHHAEAVTDYTAAVERDPDFLLAYLNRGHTLLLLKRYPEALADFDRAAKLATDDTARLSAHAGRGEALEALGRPQEADAAFAVAFAPGRSVAPEVLDRARKAYAFLVHARLPRRAREAFAEVLRHRPDDAEALYGQALLLLEQPDQDRAQEQEALLYLNQALQADPRLAEARRIRGVLLARLHRFEEAGQDVNLCLEGARSGPNCYAAACVSALLAETWGPGKGENRAQAEAAANQALGFLQDAFARGYGRDHAADDPDLAALRRHPEFQRLLKQNP
jgi:serine/threonine protein kinase/Tfp pilus assembly protein PilF